MRRTGLFAELVTRPGRGAANNVSSQQQKHCNQATVAFKSFGLRRGKKKHASSAIFANNDMKVPQTVVCKNLDDDEERFYLIVCKCCLFE